MAIVVTSRDFLPGAEIPREFTCEGADRSPSLTWSAVPAGAKSLALVVEDPDAPDPAAPKRIWTHWLLYDLPPTLTDLPAGVARERLPPGTREGRNDWERTGYGGPCPPVGRHRYYFRVYALDAFLPDLGTPGRLALLEAMKGHVIGQGELMGTYQKKER